MTVPLAPLLSVRRLSTRIGSATIVDGVDLTIDPGETLGLVGESGCGKSMLALSIAQLVPRGGRVEGSVHLGGIELGGLSDSAVRRLRGHRVGFVFQDPMSSLNPVLSIGEQISEVLRLHRGMSAAGARSRAIELMDMVEMPGAARRISDYPHQLSGGQRQRVMIAIAIACHPELLIADEPTTALDVTVQAQILALLSRLQKELGMAMLLITHDLGVVYETADRVAVMYAGRIVESGLAAAVLESPVHPYTRALLASVPPLERTLERLPSIEGVVPAPGAIVRGCRFADRCGFTRDRCRETTPELEPARQASWVACLRHGELETTGYADE